MSLSPPIWRYPQPNTSASKREEDLINAYEAEEEKVINILSRKLEKVCTIVIFPADPTSLTSSGHSVSPSLTSFVKRRLNSRMCSKLSLKHK
jgi:hypothetical protein